MKLNRRIILDLDTGLSDIVFNDYIYSTLIYDN